MIEEETLIANAHFHKLHEMSKITNGQYSFDRFNSTYKAM